MKEHSLTENDLHNIYQRITWDASADAKATRADIAGNKMKGDLQQRITRACSLAVEAVVRAHSEGRKGKLLDIGCGHGSIVPSLDLPDLDSYVGIDLSEEMIKNAVERYGHEKNKHGRGRVFVADDFLTHDFSVYAEDNSSSKDSTEVFDAVIFCSSLHDLPDMENCIGRAASLLLPGGKLIVVHAQGALVCKVISFQRTLWRISHYLVAIQIIVSTNSMF
jgi:SAM-dependent methyltransferase